MCWFEHRHGRTRLAPLRPVIQVNDDGGSDEGEVVVMRNIHYKFGNHWHIYGDEIKHILR